MIKDRVFPDRIDSYLGQVVSLEADAVPPSDKDESLSHWNKPPLPLEAIIS
jgi:hypothetical protein